MFIPNQKNIELMLSSIRYVCENFKNRVAGSQTERRCQEFFQEQISKYSDSTGLEEFSLHPNAFLGWIKTAAILSVASVLFFWMSWYKTRWFAVIAALCITFSVLMYLFEFILYRRFIDFMFPKASSINMMARRGPKGTLTRRIVFVGHADAPYEWRYTLHGKIRALLPVMAGATLSLLFIFASTIIFAIGRLSGAEGSITSGIWPIIGICQLVCIPFFIAIFFFINWRVITDGANDNLSGCYVAMAVLKELYDKKIRFKNTEVCCLITGAEEAGLRGSLAYAKRHQKDFSDVETIFIALDTLRECEHLKVYTRGQTGTQKNSKEVADLLVKSAHQCGIHLNEAGIYPGATDAESFSRYGLKAAALCGVDHNPQTYYHTRKDTWYNVDPKCLKKALEICLETIVQFDKASLPQPYKEAL